MTIAAYAGARPPKVHMDDIIRVQQDLRVWQLILEAVVAELGVTSTALYRHVEGRWGLERLVGDEHVAELELRNDPAPDPVEICSLVGCSCEPSLCIIPVYVQTLFPRGEGGLAAETEALQRRGYSAKAATVLCSAVAALAIGYAAAEQAQQERMDGLDEQRQESLEMILTDAHLGEAHRVLPEVDADEYVRMWLGAAISGLVHVAPPGRPVDEIRMALHATGEGM